jgi:hypothetical protein
MGLTAEAGPLVTFGQAQLFESNPQLGPNAWFQGDYLLDPRVPYTYQPGQNATSKNYGWYTATYIPVIDQVPSAANAYNLVSSATVSGTSPLTLVTSSGSGITVGCVITNALTGATVSGLLGIDVNSASAPQPPVAFGSDAAQAIWNPAWAVSRALVLTNNGDDVSGTYTVNGYDIYGFPMTQVVSGLNTGSAATLKAFKYLASVVPGGTISSTTVSLGTTDTYGIPLRTDRAPYIQVWWGTPPGLVIGAGGAAGAAQMLELPFQFADWTTSGGTYNIDPGFDGTINAINLRVFKTPTGTGASQVIHAQVNGTVTSGGLLSATLADTSAGPGTLVSGTTISGANTFTATQAIGITITSGGTVFSAGDGVIELQVTNNDLAGGTFTAAVTTSPATTLTGDVRGTFATPSVSDGTKRLIMFWSPIPANMTTTSGLCGVPQV